jgi:SAM-dependent methyltransferase
MDLDTFRELLAPPGRRALAVAASLAPTEAGYLAAFGKLSKQFPAALAHAALETTLLRLRAKLRQPLADQFFFTRESLEQSSSEAVARYRSRRFARFGTVLDLCCGAGMDAIALAAAGCTVDAIDSDPLRLAMAEANAVAANVAERIHFHLGDVLTLPLPEADAAFFDPSRRGGERRFLAPSLYQPPLESILARFTAGFPIGVKIAPGVARHDLEPFDAEAEFVSSNGELKECVLWFGFLRSAWRRATVLPDHTLAAESPIYEPPAEEPGRFLYDPDSSVIRADLLGLLAEQLAAAPLEPGVALLSSAERIATPFAVGYRIEAVLPFKVETLRDHLKARGIGRVTILTRAVDVDVNAVQKKLKLAGREHRHVFLTRMNGKTAAIIATIPE